MTRSVRILHRISHGGALSALLALAPFAAAETAQVELAARDIVAIHRQFGGFSDALPAAASLGVERIVAYEENAHFTYAVGRTGTRHTRRIVLLKPNILVVDDIVPGSEARWPLSSSGKAAISERTCTVREGDVVIECETLLPKGAKPVSTAGGAEVTAKADGQTVRFLHVIRVGEGKFSVGALETESGVAGLKLTSGDRLFGLTLPADVAGPGTIAVTQTGGKDLLPQRLLPSGIMPHGEKGAKLLERWDSSYRRKNLPGWDVGRPAAELKKTVEGGTIKPGRALVLGCGTGSSAIYLAGKGFDVTAVDVAPTALTFAKAKADKAGVNVRWLVADVVALPELRPPFDFIFDRGCYHHVRRYNAKGFVENVRRLTHEGSLFLLLAGNANEARHYGPPRGKETELIADYAAAFAFQELRDPNRKGGPMAWYALLRRRE